MRISLDWVRRILAVDDLGVDTDELVRRLTLHLAEIDAVERTGPDLPATVVVGRVVHCAAHPDADRLRVTRVDVGAGEPLPIVCGADNVAVDQHVAVALPKTRLTVPGRDGAATTITIKKGKLRGEPSHGMICAEDELGLGDDHDGILVLADAPAPGTPLIDALPPGDTVLVVDNHNINHRPDLWGHLGWAREIAALCDLPTPSPPDSTWSPHGDDCAVRIAAEACTGYCGAVVTGVAQGEAPAWMQDRLRAAGVRPLGLLVDVTNYVMLELGEPMHAFDRRDLHGAEILVRTAKPGERLTTLDDRTLELDPADLVITDGQRVHALAGVMGGAESGVRADTTCIVLEAATFDPAAVRRARIRHGLMTESASRFEKGLYPQLRAAAINRAVALLADACPDATVTCRFGAGADDAPAVRIPYRHEAVARYVGLEIPAADQDRHLAALGFVRDGDTVAVPWWRGKDVEEATDLVEEVARLHGYHHVTPEVPRLPAAPPQQNPLRAAEHRARRLLAAQGWDEVQTYCFTSTAWAELLAWPAERRIRLDHPLSSEQTVLRLEVLPTLAEAVARNRRYLDHVAVYEVGKIYGRGIGVEPCVDETGVVAGCHAAAGVDTPFYAARDAALAVLDGLGYVADYRAVAAPGPAWQDGRCAELRVAGRAVGIVGECPAAVRRLADCDDPLAGFVIELERLVAGNARPAPVAYRPPSRFQVVTRDFTFVCRDDLAYGELVAAARHGAAALVRDVELAQDIYRGAGIPDDHKAISIRVALQADDRTLGERDLQKASTAIVAAVERRTDAQLRA